MNRVLKQQHHHQIQKHQSNPKKEASINEFSVGLTDVVRFNQIQSSVNG